MASSRIPIGAEMYIRNDLLAGRSIQSIAFDLGLSYNTVAKRYRKLVDQGEIEDRIKHPFYLRVPNELQDFLKLKKGEYIEFPPDRKDDCDYTVAFLNKQCIRTRNNGRYGRIAHRWLVKAEEDKVKIVKIK